jgi:hypothetical protein
MNRLLLVTALCAAIPTYAAEVDTATVDFAVTVAARLMGERKPVGRPRLRYVTPVQMCVDLSSHDCVGSASGYHTEGTITLPDTIDMSAEWDFSILLHETVHWIQYQRLGSMRDHDCRERSIREAQAYYVQTQYLRNVGIMHKQSAEIAYRSGMVASTEIFSCDVPKRFQTMKWSDDYAKLDASDLRNDGLVRRRPRLNHRSAAP